MRLAQIYRRELAGPPPAPLQKKTELPTATTLADMFRQACNTFATRQAYIVDEQWITYGQAHDRAQMLADSLTTLQGPCAGELKALHQAIPNHHIGRIQTKSNQPFFESLHDTGERRKV